MERDTRPFVEIHSSKLLGYRGEPKYFRWYTPGLPQTVDGSPILSASQLEWRPRIQTAPKI